MGRNIKSLINISQPAGYYEINWNELLMWHGSMWHETIILQLKEATRLKIISQPFLTPNNYSRYHNYNPPCEDPSDNRNPPPFVNVTLLGSRTCPKIWDQIPENTFHPCNH